MDHCAKCGRLTMLLTSNGYCLACQEELDKGMAAMRTNDTYAPASDTPTQHIPCCVGCNQPSALMNDGYCPKCYAAKYHKANETATFREIVEPIRVACSVCGASSENVAFIDSEGKCKDCKMKEVAAYINEPEKKLQSGEVVRTPVVNMMIEPDEMKRAQMSAEDTNEYLRTKRIMDSMEPEKITVDDDKPEVED